MGVITKAQTLSIIVEKLEQDREEALKEVSPGERGEFAAYHRGRADGLKEAAAFCKGLLSGAEGAGDSKQHYPKEESVSG